MRYLILILALLGSAVAQKPVAQLPQTTVDVSWRCGGGPTVPVHTAAQLQPALNAATGGTVIVLDAGVTYTGYFRLNPTTGGWVCVTTGNFVQLHPSGVRVTPGDGKDMAKVVTPNVAAVFQV